MTFDFKNFLHRLEEGRPTSSEIAQLVEEEIAKAESLKMGFAEEVEREPEFVSQTLRQITDYVLHLQNVQRWFPRLPFAEDLLPREDPEDRPMVQEKIAVLLRDLGEEGEGSVF
jgi:predicted transcriptional regulator